MRNALLVSAFLFSSVFAFAQKAEDRQKRSTPLKDKLEIEWGAESKSSMRLRPSDYIGNINGNGYMLKTKAKMGKSGVFFIEVIDDRMNVVKTSELVLETKTDDLDFERVFIFDDKLYVGASLRNGAKKRKTLFVQELDSETLTPVDAFKKISEFSYEDGSKRNSGSFRSSFNQDSTLIMILYDIPGGKSDRERFGIEVFDKELELVWKKDITLPYKEADFSVIDYEMDIAGNAYVLGRRVVDKSGKKEEVELEVLKYSPDEEDAVVYKLELPGKKYINGFRLQFKDNEIWCLGFYSKDARSGTQGCFVMRVNKDTGELIQQNQQEFPLDFITMNTTEKSQRRTESKAAKGKDVGIANLYIRNVIDTKTGQVIVVAEVYFVKVYTSSTATAGGGRTTSTTYVYHYNDIVLFSIGSELDILWYNKIPKAQVTADDYGYYSSFYSHKTADRLLIVYNDHIDNLKVVKSGKPARFTGSRKTSVAVGVTVDFDGNIGKSRLFDVKNTKSYMRPKAAGTGEDDQMIIHTTTGKTQRYAKVGIK